MPTRPSSLPGLIHRELAASLAQLSDRQLLDRFTARGDEAAFAAIVDRHGPMLLGLSRRLVNDAHLAEDVLQATFPVLARNAGSIRQRESLPSWLHGVAVRIGRQARLANAARFRRERTASRPDVVAAKPAWDELLQVLDEELAKLPDQVRSPLLLCYLEGRTQDEAAKQLGLSVSTLRRRLAHGQELLRARMTRRRATLGAGLFATFLSESGATAALPSALRQSLLKLAAPGSAGVATSPAVVALAQGVLRMHVFRKVVALGLAVLFVAMTGAGLVVWSAGFAREEDDPPAQEARKPPEQPAAGQAAAAETLLPDGAVVRLGSLAFRHGRAAGGSLTFVPDGKYLVSAGGGWIRRWDLATGEAAVNLGDGWRSTPSSPGFVAATADGAVGLVFSSAPQPPQGILNLWTAYDLRTGERAKHREGTTRADASRGLPRWPDHVSPSGTYLARVDGTGFMSIVEWASGKQLHPLRPERGRYAALTFHPNDKLVIAADDSHVIHLIDLATGQRQRTFGTPGETTALKVAVSPNGKWLATIGRNKGNGSPPTDSLMRLWDLDAGALVQMLPLPSESNVDALAFSGDSQKLFAATSGWRAGRPVKVTCWDVATGEQVRTWTEERDRVAALATSPDGKELATMTSPGIIRFWDVETGAERRTSTSGSGPLLGIAYSADGKTVLTFGGDSQLSTWDVATGRRVATKRIPGEGTVGSLIANGKYVATFVYDGGFDRRIEVRDVATGDVVHRGPADRMVVSPDGKKLAVSGWSDGVSIFDLEAKRERPELQLPRLGQSSARGRPIYLFTTDGLSLVALGQTLESWNLATRRKSFSWSLIDQGVLEPKPDVHNESNEQVQAAVLSPDGSRIAMSMLRYRPPDPTGNVDWFGQVVVCETATGKVLHRADLRKEIMECLAFSPDGKLLAAGGGRTLSVWNAETGQRLHVFQGHRGTIRGLAFSPDSKRLASASEDGTALVWDLAK